jgi:hypothetical protein
MVANFSSLKGSIVNRDLVQPPIQPELSVVAAAKKQFDHGRPQSRLKDAFNLWFRPPIQMNAHTIAIANENDVVPRLQGQRRATNQQFIAFSAMEKKQLARQLRTETSTDPKVFAGCGTVSIHPA